MSRNSIAGSAGMLTGDWRQLLMYDLGAVGASSFGNVLAQSVRGFASAAASWKPGGAAPIIADVAAGEREAEVIS
eukprot:4570712-Amphidinium_carterae.1